jgi:hypothetical protein
MGRSDEEILGVYQNPEEYGGEWVLVTTRRLVVGRSNAEREIGFVDVESVEGPTDKSARDGVRVRTREGSIIFLPIRGGEGRFRDAFEFMRFVMRAKNE